jgi:hypothetical protein
LAYFYVASYATSEALIAKKDYGAAVAELRLCVEISPKPWAYVALGRALALKKDKGKALEALQNAVAAGFRDRSALEREKAFDVLREDPDYQRIVEGMKPAP